MVQRTAKHRFGRAAPRVKDGGDRRCCKKEVETQSKFSPWAAAHKSRINNLEYLLRREYYERRKET